MANLEERVAIVEAQADRHATAIEGLRSDMSSLRVELRTEIAAVRSEMALRSEMTEFRAEVRELARRWDRFFLWLAGTQVATLLAVIGVLMGILYR